MEVEVCGYLDARHPRRLHVSRLTLPDSQEELIEGLIGISPEQSGNPIFHKSDGRLVLTGIHVQLSKEKEKEVGRIIQLN